MIHRTSSPLHLEGPLTGEDIRHLVAHCQELTCCYRTTPAVALDRAWWQTLYQAGISLRDALEESRDQWQRMQLTDKEIEHAYLLLIHVAYFFEPGGVAEVVFREQGWVWSDHEQALALA